MIPKIKFKRFLTKSAVFAIRKVSLNSTGRFQRQFSRIMERIGDSALIGEDKIEKFEDQVVEFERNLDLLKENLQSEEARLESLEERRLKLQIQIEDLMNEVHQEKMLYREAIDGCISEQEKLAQELDGDFDGLDDLKETASALSILDECHSAVESVRNLDITIDNEIEKIRCDLMESYITTKEDYLSTMKESIQKKKEKLAVQEARNDGTA